jgi:hypothetical protein
MENSFYLQSIIIASKVNAVFAFSFGQHHEGAGHRICKRQKVLFRARLAADSVECMVIFYQKEKIDEQRAGYPTFVKHDPNTQRRPVKVRFTTILIRESHIQKGKMMYRIRTTRYPEESISLSTSSAGGCPSTHRPLTNISTSSAATSRTTTAI